MNAEQEFEYASYKKVHQPQYDESTQCDYFQRKLYSYINFDMRSQFPKEPEDKVKVLQELYDSEKAYVIFLTVVSEVFVGNLAASGTVSKKRMRSLFGDIGAICQTNQLLLESLRSKSVADAFLQLLPYLKLYTSYASQYPTSLKTYAELMSRENFRREIAKIESDSRCQNNNLNALLIMPVQRIPRYILLLEKLMMFSTEPQEMHNLCKVVGEMRTLSDHMQLCMLTYENGERLLTIQKSFGLDKHVFVPGRTLIKEGMLYKREMSGSALFQERIFYLFNDVLLYGKKRMRIGSKLEPSAMISLRHTQIEHVPVEGTIHLRCGELRLVITADTFECVKEWYDTIATAIGRSKLLRKTLRKESFNKKVMIFDKGFWRRRRDALRSMVANNDVTTTVERVFSRRRPLEQLNDSEFLSGNWTNRKRKNSVESMPKNTKVKRHETTDLIREMKQVFEKQKKAYDNVLETQNYVVSQSSSSSMGDTDSAADSVMDEEPEMPLETPILFQKQQDEKVEEEELGIDEEDRRPRTFGAERERLAVSEIRKLSYQQYDYPKVVEEEEEVPRESKKQPWWATECAPPAIANQKPSLFESVKSNCTIM
ncbi:unnamed protein product [Caenorhabditis angaria]|uniref:DH domain-containing protein n=1 Tax=Caenorhabditis angaria TaxID=860376 RepID=A0A9P1J0B4_9PELO|nr:unnamed protein product [Caenorhabditis angaria]